MGIGVDGSTRIILVKIVECAIQNTEKELKHARAEALALEVHFELQELLHYMANPPEDPIYAYHTKGPAINAQGVHDKINPGNTYFALVRMGEIVGGMQYWEGTRLALTDWEKAKQAVLERQDIVQSLVKKGLLDERSFGTEFTATVEEVEDDSEVVEQSAAEFVIPLLKGMSPKEQNIIGVISADGLRHTWRMIKQQACDCGLSSTDGTFKENDPHSNSILGRMSRGPRLQLPICVDSHC